MDKESLREDKHRLHKEDYEKMKEYVEELEFKREMGLPEKAKPII